MRRLAFAFLVLLLQGCMSMGNPAVQYEALTSQIEPGKSTKADVRALLGKPTTVATVTINGQRLETWYYSYSDIHTSPWTYVPIIGLFAGSAKVETASYSVTFPDGRDVVQDITRSHFTGESGPFGQGAHSHGSVDTTIGTGGDQPTTVNVEVEQ